MHCSVGTIISRSLLSACACDMLEAHAVVPHPFFGDSAWQLVLHLLRGLLTFNWPFCYPLLHTETAKGAACGQRCCI